MTGPAARKVVLAAGGTGGHMFPAQALARELLSRGHAVVLITDRRGGGFGPDLPQVETFRINAGGVAGGGIVKKARGLASLALGVLQARRIFKGLGADTVVGFGGYPSVPSILAGSWAGLHIVLHDQNAVIGLANRLLASRARAIATSFAKVEGLRPVDRLKIAVTGNPVRPEIAELGQRPYAVPDEQGRLSLFVMGGSLGAQVFNEAVPAAVRDLPESIRARLDVVQQVRGDALDDVAALYRDCGVAAELASFFDDVPGRLARAHLVVCRAGGSTTAELANAGRPAILVPYPHHVDNQQLANAQALAEAGGGWVMPQATLTAEALSERLGSLFATPALLTRAAQCAAAFAERDAARRLADLVCDDLRSNGDPNSGGADDKEAAA